MTDQTIITPSPAFGLRNVLPTLFVDAALPVIVFDVLMARGVAVIWALAAGGVPPALNNLRTWIKARRLEPLGIIVMTLLAVGTLASLISGNVLFALIKGSFLTAAFGLICLGSLFAARPLMFYVFRQFVAGDDAARIESWNLRWDIGGFRRALRFVTAVWGVTYLVQAALGIGLAIALTPQQVVTISPITGFGALIALIAWSRRTMLPFRRS